MGFEQKSRFPQIFEDIPDDALCVRRAGMGCVVYHFDNRGLHRTVGTKQQSRFSQLLQDVLD